MSYDRMDGGAFDAKKYLTEGFTNWKFETDWPMTSGSWKLFNWGLQKWIIVFIVSFIIGIVCSIAGAGCFAAGGSWRLIGTALYVVWAISWMAMFIGILMGFSGAKGGAKRLLQSARYEAGKNLPRYARMAEQRYGHKLQPHGGGVRLGNYSVDYQFKKGF